MLPLSDGLAARRFPIVNILLIAANFAVWLFDQSPTLTRPSITPRSTRARSTVPATALRRGG